MLIKCITRTLWTPQAAGLHIFSCTRRWPPPTFMHALCLIMFLQNHPSIILRFRFCNPANQTPCPNRNEFLSARPEKTFAPQKKSHHPSLKLNAWFLITNHTFSFNYQPYWHVRKSISHMTSQTSCLSHNKVSMFCCLTGSCLSIGRKQSWNLEMRGNNGDRDPLNVWLDFNGNRCVLTLQSRCHICHLPLFHFISDIAFENVFGEYI